MAQYTLGLIGVAVFAISGAIAAGKKHYDWVGVVVIAAVTALGGGTIRDVLLNRPAVFWIDDPAYVWVTIGACLATLILVRSMKIPYRALLLADAVGLALFSLSGAQIAEQLGHAPVVVVLMGAITGAAGGVVRDVLTGATPVLFKADEPLYSTAAVSGIVVYLGLQEIGFETLPASLAGIGVIIIVRFAAIFWNIRLPAFDVKD